MTDLQLYSDISSLPDELKQEVSNFVSFLKQKSKEKNKMIRSANSLVETPAKAKFSQILLAGPTFSKEQITSINENRKTINKWRTKL